MRDTTEMDTPIFTALLAELFGEREDPSAPAPKVEVEQSVDA